MRELCCLIGGYVKDSGKSIEEVFDEVDEDENGDMDIDEFIYYFSNLKNQFSANTRIKQRELIQKLTQENLRALFEYIGPDASGRLGFGEFCALLGPKRAARETSRELSYEEAGGIRQDCE